MYIIRCINFQVSIRSVQADKNITFPFNVYVNEMKFGAEGAAILTSQNKSETEWEIDCDPEKVW